MSSNLTLSVRGKEERGERNEETEFLGPFSSFRIWFQGWVAEWLKAHAWKACGRATVSRVRISPHPCADNNPTTSYWRVRLLRGRSRGAGALNFPGERGLRKLAWRRGYGVAQTDTVAAALRPALVVMVNVALPGAPPLTRHVSPIPEESITAVVESDDEQ